LVKYAKSDAVFEIRQLDGPTSALGFEKKQQVFQW